MAEFIIEGFTHYKVTLFNSSENTLLKSSITINIDSGTVIIKFMEGDLPANNVKLVGTKKQYTVHARAENYPNYIDLMRHEQPVYFYYSDKESYITTSDEPVGEGNVDNSN